MKRFFSIYLLVLLITFSNAQSQNPTDSTAKKYFIGSTLFVLGNFVPDDPNSPEFVQLNFGYRITTKDVVSIELKTWKYAWPLGIPYGDSFLDEEEEYPGYIREVGIAFVYQRFFWKGAYAAIHAMNAYQIYVDEADKKIQNGYQLFMTYRFGYQFTFFNNKFFIEPSIAFTHWPINTNVPASFKALEKKWDNFFLFEPGFHFGFNF